MLNPSLSPSAPTPSGRRRIFDRGVRSALIASLVALLIHLIPLLLPRNMPEQELAIARAMPDIEQRVEVLMPLKENPKSTAADLRAAARLLMEGAPEDARELLEEAERREPGAVETPLLLARVCHQERASRCEEAALAQAAKVAPADPRVDLQRASFQEEEGDALGALESVGRAHQKAPADAAIAVRYGHLLSAAGRWEEAVGVLGRVESSLGRPRLLLELGLVHARQGRDEEAHRLFEQAVEVEPSLAAAHYHLGLAAFRLGDVEGAEQALRTADRLNMADLRPLAALCAIQRQAGKLEASRITQMDLERRFPRREDVPRNPCRLETL